MLHTSAPAGSNLKLRGLLHTSRELLLQRQLKKALNNAQIAEDFALRSGEAPEIAAAAQLLRAEIYLLNAAYTHDSDLRTRGWRLLEQIAADQQSGRQWVSRAEIDFVKAISLRRLGDFDEAERLFSEVVDALDTGDPRMASTLIELALSQVQRHVVVDEGLLRDAADAIGQASDYSRATLEGQLSLARAFAALNANHLGRAIDEANGARRLAANAGDRETESLACFFLGKLSRRRGNDVIALRLLYEAMDAAEVMGSRSLLVDAHLEIGHVFAALNDDREAAKYFTFVADDAAETERTEALYAAALALGCAAERASDFTEAQQRLAAALQAASTLDWHREHGIVLAEMAGLKFKEGQLGLASHLVQEAQRRFELAATPASAKTHLTQAFLLVPNDAEQALQLAQQAENSAIREGRHELRAAALRLRSQLHEAKGDLVAALQAERAAAEVALTLFHQQRDRHLPDLDMRAALRRREREIEKLTHEAELKNALFAKTEQIERANRDLVQVNEELRQFAYVASHDLKEPLRQIGSYVSLIKRNYAHLLDERGETFFGFVTEGVGRLSRLLDSLMHYTSVARLDISVEPVDLSKMLSAVSQEIETSLRASGGRVVFEQLPTLNTSGALLHHVLAALVDNGVKFARPGKPPIVTVSVEQDDDTAIIAVRDNGIGISAGYADKVFVLFQMLHAKTEYPGTGVGLAIAQKTVQRLGGRIWFDENDGGNSPGVTFYVSLPNPVGTVRHIQG